MLPHLILALLLCLASAVIRPEDFSFTLLAGTQQCFRQTFPPHTHAVVDVLVVDGSPGVVVGVVITDPERNVLLHHVESASHSVLTISPILAKGPGAHESDTPIEIKVCLVGKRPAKWVPPQTHDRDPQPSDVRKVFVGMHEVGAKSRARDTFGLTKAKDLGGLQEVVDEMGRKIMRLSREFEYLRKREGILAKEADTTARRIVRCSVLASVFIFAAGIMSTAGMQVVLKKSQR